jgi:alpha-glucosidase
MPGDNHHRADEALGGPGPHARYHNIYGMLMVRASRDGIAAARPEKRPFILTRSNFVGGQRYAATWTGDNKSDWEHLAWSIPMVLNMGLSGQPFVGPDIGGFSGNADARLFARWMGIGALLPFARGHSIKDSADHEPWAFGPECEATCRLALNRRYRLMPYLYSLFREASVTDVPIVRPVFFADPRDPALRDVDDGFLLGPDLLVRACVDEEQTSCPSPLPRGIWREFEPCPRDDGSRDPDLPELRVRGGAILPLGPVTQFVDEVPLSPLALVVCPDADFAAAGTLYEDAGEGLGYRDGHFRLSTYRARREADHLIVERADVQGRYHERHHHDRDVEVVVLLDGAMRTGRGVDGDRISIRL